MTCNQALPDWSFIPEDIRWAAETFDLLGWNSDEQIAQQLHTLGTKTTREQVRDRAEETLARFNRIDWEQPDCGEQLAATLAHLGSNARPQFLCRFGPEIKSLDALRYVMPQAHSGWNLAMGAWPNIDKSEWLNMWRTVAYCSDGEPAPRGPLRVYRGGDARDGMWLDWTTDPATAKRFAEIEPDASYRTIWETYVQPQHVLGRIKQHDEAEVIVDYEALAADKVAVRVTPLRP